MENMELALIITLAGMVIVFAVLIMLIYVIKLFGIGVSKMEDKMKRRKELKLLKLQDTETKEVDAPKSVPVTESGGLSDQVVAVIAAAVDSMYGKGSCRIKSIKKLPQARSAWNAAGVMDNTRPF